MTNLAASEAFYVLVLGRLADRVQPGLLEWILHREPEIALRLVEGPGVDPARCRVGLGVADVDQESARLASVLGELEVVVRPGIIAELDLVDPDGYQVVLWQDLLSGTSSSGDS